MMKKRKLLAAMLICAAVSLNTKVLAVEHDINVADITNKTYDGYSTTGNGGAIQNSIASTITSSTFSNNHATNNGGALAAFANTTISASTFTQNSSDFTAGAITVQGGTISITDTNFTNNTSKYGGAIYAPVAYRDLDTGVVIRTNSTVNITGGTFSGNSALGAGAVGLFTQSTITGTTFTNNSSTSDTDGGGAIFLGAESVTTIKDAIFTENTSAFGGGAISTRNDNANNSAASLTIIGGSFEDNTAGTNGGAIDNYFYNNTSISGTKFTSNEANNGGAIYNHGEQDVQGNSAKLTITDATFSENYATKTGGAILSGSDLTITNSQFDKNSSDYMSGAIGVQGGTINITDTDFTNNTSRWGGAIYAPVAYRDTNGNIIDTNSIINITGGKFDGNSAEGAGAVGLLTQSTITGTTFSNNSATLDPDGGGAIFLGAESVTTITDAIFNNNTSAYGGGAISTRNNNANNSAASLTIIGGEFTGNTAGTSGGAVDNYFYNNTSISGTKFTGNEANEGGAIFNHGELDAQGNSAKLAITEAVFSENYATKNGGAIASASDLTITGSTFNKNDSDFTGGAIAVQGGTINITDTDFTNNTSEWGGAIFAPVAHQGRDTNSVVNITNGTFEGNSARAAGAVGLLTESTITGTSFVNNSATDANDDGGGAIFLGAESKTTITNATFDGNSSAKNGGAIATRDNIQGDNSAAALDIIGATFTNNTAAGQGGALYNTFSKNTAGTGPVTIANSVFDGNSSTGNGGAIYSEIEGATAATEGVLVTDSSFTNNTSATSGGAIYANSSVTVNSVNSDVVFSGNSASDGSGDIFLETTGSNLNLNASSGKSITLASGVSGTDYDMIVNTDSANTGSIIINSAIENATISVANGTFHLAEGSALNSSTLSMASGTTLNTMDNATTAFGNNITLADNTNLIVDVNIANGTADNFAGVTQEGKVTIAQVNTIGNTTANNVSVNLAEMLGIDPTSMVVADALQTQTQTILTPIRYLKGGVSETGIMSFVPSGNGYKDFNPSVMASPVAAQLGGYLTQLNSYDQAFRNMDMYMLMTKSQREALKLRNKYAVADGNLIFDPTNSPNSDKAAWVRPYSTFESVRLKGGPRVSNVAWGSFFGGESELYDLGNGWDGMWGVYAGYNGSHQAYDGIGIYQNGGTLGLVGMAYKGNFFTGLTVNAGANAGEANTMYGNDNFSMLMAGIASKSGYNFELADGKFIIQPNLLMAYSFVNTFDYTNAAGVRINSDPLHALTVEPGVKFIGNLKNGWQPYLGVSVVWNIMDKTEFQANDVSLPELSVKPFVRYGIGVRKTWGERFSGFLQAYFTSGGRNGVGFQAGFRFALGKGSSNSVKTGNKTPERPKTQIKLSSMN